MCDCECHKKPKESKQKPPQKPPKQRSSPPRWDPKTGPATVRKGTPYKGQLSDDKITEYSDPTPGEIDNWKPPSDIDIRKFRDALERMNLTAEQKARLMLKANRAKILSNIIPPFRNVHESQARKYETQYKGSLKVSETHLWDPLKSVGQYGALHADTQFGVTKYKSPLRFTRDTDPSGIFSIFWDVSGSNGEANERYGDQGRLYSGMECVIAYLLEARASKHLVSLYVTPNIGYQRGYVEPIEIAGKHVIPGFTASSYFFKSNDYDAMEHAVYGTYTGGEEDYMGTVPYMIRDMLVGERVKRGLAIFIADADYSKYINAKRHIEDCIPWFRMLYKSADIVYLHITDMIESEWVDAARREEYEKARWGTSGQKYWSKIQPGIVYRNVGDGSHITEIAFEELEKRDGPSAIRMGGGGIVKHVSPYMSKRK